MKKIKNLLVVSFVMIFSFALLNIQPLNEVSAEVMQVPNKVLKLTIDLGENYDQEAVRQYNQVFYSPSSEKTDITTTFSNDDVISYDVYNPDALAAGGLDGQESTSWGLYRDIATDNGTANLSWGIGTNTKWQNITRTLSTESGDHQLHGKQTYHWAVIFEDNRAQTKQVLNIYYRNIVLKDSEGKIKQVIFNETVLPNLSIADLDMNTGIESATLTVVDDPLAPAKIVNDSRVIKQTVDFSGNANKFGEFMTVFNTPMGPALSDGDYIIYEVYSPQNIASAGLLEAQVPEAGWQWLRGFNMDNTAYSFTQQLMFLQNGNIQPVSWTTLAGAGAKKYAADIGSGFVTNTLMIKNGISDDLTGKSFYHLALYGITGAPVSGDIIEVYIKNFYVKSYDGTVKYNAFDGTQLTTDLVSNQFETSEGIQTKIEIVDNPLQQDVPQRGSFEGKYIETSYLFMDTTDISKTAKTKLLENEITVETGDIFSYDVKLSTTVPGIGTLDIEFTDGTYLTSCNVLDNIGIEYIASSDISSLTSGALFSNPVLTRKVTIPESCNGKTIKAIYSVAQIDSAVTDIVAKASFDNIKINDTVIYDETQFDSSIAGTVESSGSLVASVAVEPILAPEVEPDKYFTVNYSITDKESDVNRFFDISLYDYMGNICDISVGDRFSYDIKVSDNVANSNFYLDFQYMPSWGMISNTVTKDQRGYTGNDSSFLEDDVWVTRYFDITDPNMLNNTVAHWRLRVDVNGVQTIDNFSISITNAKIIKPNGDVFYIADGENARVFEQSLGIFGQPESYKSGIQIESLVPTGYIYDDSIEDFDKALEFDLKIGANGSGEVPRKETKIDIFATEIPQYIVKEGDVFSYVFKMSAPMGGVGNLDLQFIDPSDESGNWFSVYNNSGAVKDNYGISYRSNNDISFIGYNQWAERSVLLPQEAIGKNIQHIAFAISNASWLNCYDLYDIEDEEMGYIRQLKVWISSIKITSLDGEETYFYDGSERVDTEGIISFDDAGDIVWEVKNVKLESGAYIEDIAPIIDDEDDIDDEDKDGEEGGCASCSGTILYSNIISLMLVLSAALIIVKRRTIKK